MRPAASAKLGNNNAEAKYMRGFKYCQQFDQHYGGDGRDLLQLLNNGSLANVPGVEYMIDASEVP